MIIYKCNMAGPYHIDNNLPCQDSFAIKHGKDRFVIAAVADGLGSELYSDIGSSVAAQAAVDYCSEHITAAMTFEDLKKVMNNALVYAYKAVLTKAGEDGNDPDEYDTTLCLAVYDGEHLYYAQSGDSGMVALLETGEFYRVTTQQRDEEGRVFPLCWGPDKWEFGFVDSSVSAVMLMTDGVFEQICPKMMRNQEVDINIPLARKFLDRFDCVEEDIPELENAVYKYLENYPRHLLDDDKTIVVLINTDRKPAQKEEAYYAIPDWNALRSEAEKKLAEFNEKNSAESEMKESDSGTDTGDSISEEAPEKDSCTIVHVVTAAAIKTADMKKRYIDSVAPAQTAETTKGSTKKNQIPGQHFDCRI